MPTTRTLRTQPVNRGSSHVSSKVTYTKPVRQRKPSFVPNQSGATLIGRQRLAKKILTRSYTTMESLCTGEGFSSKEAAERLAELVSCGLITDEEVKTLLPKKPAPPVLIIEKLRNHR
jgi:hypothetical protein